MSKKFEMEQLLREIYYDPLEGYSSATQLYKKAKEKGLNVTFGQIKKWLSHQETYVRFRQPQKKFKRRQTYVSYMGQQLQIDLVDISKYEKENQNYRWILTGIDVFSRYLLAIPLKRKHKEFTVNAVKFLLEKFEERFGQLPDFVQMDDGGEFKDTKVLPLLKEKNIKYFSTRLTSKKVSVVERANRTLKTKMLHFFDYERKKEWIYVLDSLTQNINKTVNTTIGMAPEDVNNENEKIVFTKLYGHANHLKQPTYKVNDLVLLTKYSNPLNDQNKKLFKKVIRQILPEKIIPFQKLVEVIHTFTR